MFSWPPVSVVSHNGVWTNLVRVVAYLIVRSHTINGFRARISIHVNLSRLIQGFEKKIEIKRFRINYSTSLPFPDVFSEEPPQFRGLGVFSMLCFYLLDGVGQVVIVGDGVSMSVWFEEKTSGKGRLVL